MEIDGSIKHIELLSYRPSIGWSKYDPSQDPDMVTIRKELTGMSEEVIERTLDCCRRSVFRMYRVIGLSPGADKVPVSNRKHRISEHICQLCSGPDGN